MTGVNFPQCDAGVTWRASSTGACMDFKESCQEFWQIQSQTDKRLKQAWEIGGRSARFSFGALSNLAKRGGHNFWGFQTLFRSGHWRSRSRVNINWTLSIKKPLCDLLENKRPQILEPECDTAVVHYRPFSHSMLFGPSSNGISGFQNWFFWPSPRNDDDIHNCDL